eukprot:Gb_40043 [translate_table: standard]
MVNRPSCCASLLLSVSSSLARKWCVLSVEMASLKKWLMGSAINYDQIVKHVLGGCESMFEFLLENLQHRFHLQKKASSCEGVEDEIEGGGSESLLLHEDGQDVALKMVGLMGCAPDAMTYSTIINSLYDQGRLQKCSQASYLDEDPRFQLDFVAYNTLMNNFCKLEPQPVEVLASCGICKSSNDLCLDCHVDILPKQINYKRLLKGFIGTLMVLNSPFDVKASLATKFIDKALEFKPKLVILIVLKETKRSDEECRHMVVEERRSRKPTNGREEPLNHVKAEHEESKEDIQMPNQEKLDSRKPQKDSKSTITLDLSCFFGTLCRDDPDIVHDC